MVGRSKAGEPAGTPAAAAGERKHADSLGGLNQAMETAESTGGGVDPRPDAAIRRAALEPGATIHARLRAVRLDVGFIGKDKRNTGVGGGFAFRGIDDALNFVGPVMVRYGVTVALESSDLNLTREVVELDNGKERVESHASIKMRVRFCCEPPLDVQANDPAYAVEQVTYGEGMDYGGDKAINKAMAAAFKYAIFLGLALPVAPEALPDSDHDPREQERGRSRIVKGQQDRRPGNAPEASPARAPMQTCPACGAEAVIAGKPEYGGGFICWKNRGGCGAKFATERELTGGQPHTPEPPAGTPTGPPATSEPAGPTGNPPSPASPAGEAPKPTAAEKRSAVAKSKFWAFCQQCDPPLNQETAADIWKRFYTNPPRAELEAYCVSRAVETGLSDAAWTQYKTRDAAIKAIEATLSAVDQFDDQA